MFVAPNQLAHSERDRDIVDLTNEDDTGFIETELVRHVEPAIHATPTATRQDAPPDALPRKKRKSEKREQIERAFRQYLFSLSDSQRSIVLRGFTKISLQKDSMLRLRQQLKTDLQANAQRLDLQRCFNTVDKVLCNIDEYIVGIREGTIPAADVPGVARKASNEADGVRHHIDALSREEALMTLQRREGTVTRDQLLSDPAYIDARSRSLVTPTPTSTFSGYAPGQNPAASNQFVYQEALRNSQNPGWLPDGRYITQMETPNLPFFHEPPGFNRREPVEPDPSTEALVDLAKTDAEPLEMPPQLDCTSLEHQKQGLGWLVRAERGRYKGGILADDMGLGKTMQTIALIYQNPPAPEDDQNVRQVLIVCPVALIQTWADELQTRVHEPYRKRLYLHHRGSNNDRLFTRASEIRANTDVVICTYHAVMNEYKQLVRQQEHGTGGPHPLFDMKWHRIVLDEAHAIKNRNAQVSIASSFLKARYRLVLTGTPMQNRIEELFPLVRFLHISPYGNSWFEFKALVPMTHDAGGPRFESQKALAAFLSAIMLRRLKDTVIKGRKIIDNLPRKHTKDIYVDLTGDELASYKHLEENLMDELKGLVATDGSKAKKISSLEEQLTFNNMLVMLLRLRQTACHPLLVAITKKAKGSRVWGNNEHTRKEVKRARHIEGQVSQIALETSDDERLCVVCGGPSAVLHETFLYNICGDVLCSECATSQRSDLDNQLSDGDLEGVQCPKCERRSYYVANLEVVSVMHERPGLRNQEYVDLLVEQQQPRVEQYQREEAERRRRLEELRYNENSLVNLLLDSDYEEATPTPDMSNTVPTDVKLNDPLAYKTDVDELARLFYVRGIFKDGWVTSAKVESCLNTLREIWQEAPNDKVIIFSSFTALLDVITIPLEAARVPYLQYTGKMDAISRNEVLKQFREGACRVLLTSMKAGNVGLTLTQANRVIILEPFWNPYVEEQAQDRVYRIGQSREVTIYRIRLRDTVEDRIVKLQDKKRELIEAALDPSMKTQAQGLSRSDLIFALGLHSRRGNASQSEPV